MELAGEWTLLETESSGSDGGAAMLEQGGMQRGNCRRDWKIKYGNGPNIYMRPTGERHKREGNIGRNNMDKFHTIKEKGTALG